MINRNKPDLQGKNWRFWVSPYTGFFLPNLLEFDDDDFKINENLLNREIFEVIRKIMDFYNIKSLYWFVNRTRISNIQRYIENEFKLNLKSQIEGYCDIWEVSKK